MSKYIKSIPLDRIERVAIVLGNGRLASEVKRDTGCNYTMNAGFYGADGKPTHHLKADGKVLARAPWGCWGFAWDTGPDIKLEVLPAESRKNYIAGVELLSPMVSEIGLQYDRKGELGGIRGRTAVATSVTHLTLYCSGDGTIDASTLEGVKAELQQLGAMSAIYVDGGGSSQCDFGNGEVIYSVRKVYSYLCVWLKNESKEDKPMTEKQIRANIVSIAKAFVGATVGSAAHKDIIDTYNTIRPLPRGYKVTYTDSWCAAFVSAIAVKAGLTDIIPPECSCNSMIQFFQRMGRWQEDDAYKPQIGDILFYDWDDSGVGDNKGAADHVGIVSAVTGATITVIEGNYNKAVRERTMQVNGRYIRGYGLPDYAAKADKPAPAVDTYGAADWAASAWAKAKDKGIMDGTRPTEGVTRQELAVVLDRLKLI